MKVTKRQLKKIIKEELEAALSEQSADPEVEKAKETAQVLSQSPAIMAAIKQAMQDPKVQAALEQATSGDMQEGKGPLDHLDFEGDPVGQAYKGAADFGDTASDVSLGIAGVGAAISLTPGALALIGGALVVTGPMAAAGILGGFTIMGASMIAAQLFMSSKNEYTDKATNIHKRNPIKDFGQKGYEKIMSKGK